MSLGVKKDEELFLPADKGKKMPGSKERLMLGVTQLILTTLTDTESNDSKGEAQQDGFKYDDQVYIDYVRWRSATATKYSIVKWLKNALEISEKVLDVAGFAVNEPCHEVDGE
ncbi:hypothetical protein PMIN05_011384 [Paraphaeosphaeria minitans]